MKSFFKNKGPFDINFLINKTSFTEKSKQKKTKVKDVSTLKEASKSDITFFESKKYIDDLKKTNAGFCLIKKNDFEETNLSKTTPIISSNPLLDFVLIATQFYPDATKDNYNFKQSLKYKSLNKKGTYIDSNVKIGKKFEVGINSTIKKNVIIGDNVSIGSNCVISNSVIGNNVRINDGTIIGKIGYGFKYINKKLSFIPHIGHVEIGNDVYIASNCSIDRGSFTNTIIKNNTMIDNNVHIAHNVSIGSYCYITGQVGIAGSTMIGDNCMIGGQSGISGHLRIGDNVHIGGHSGVLNDLKSGSKVMGFPAVPIREFVKRRKNDW